MRLLLLPVIVVVAVGCGTAKSSYSPYKKYSPSQLQRDYAAYRELLEEAHPGLYWYTAKDSMDHYFDWGREQLNDSLHEPAFRRVLNYVTSKINCGHTSIRASKKFLRHQDSAGIPRAFPLTMKLWEDERSGADTMVVAGNLNRRDSVLRPGTVITKINGKTTAELVDTLFNYVSTDGFNRTHKFQTLSNRGYFGSLYSSLFGYPPRYYIEYLDPDGQPRAVSVPVYLPGRDSAARAAAAAVRQLPQPSRKERRDQRLNDLRLLEVDTASSTAYMTLASFGRGFGLKRFFRGSFRLLRKHAIGQLVIDVRSNGGGSVTNSTLLTRYLATEKFKVADSLYAIAKKKKHGRYIQGDFFNRLFITFFAGRKKDGLYHFRYFERHYFKPKKQNHFDGNAYVLIGGNSFSATTLFVGTIMKQDNVTVIGEETGGGAYGNTAWLIPDVVLPETKVRFRLPLFRLVVDRNLPKNGRGVQPEILVPPTTEAVRRRIDLKKEKAFELIKKQKEADAGRTAVPGADQ